MIFPLRLKMSVNAAGPIGRSIGPLKHLSTLENFLDARRFADFFFFLSFLYWLLVAKFQHELCESDTLCAVLNHK